jgi:AraC-like DNA-binding protein
VADDQGWQRVGSLIEIPNVLRALGIAPDTVLTRAGLAPDALASTDSMITFSAAARLLQCCAELSNCGHFGLLVGRRARIEHFGMVGRLMQNAPDLGTAIRDLGENQHRYARGAVIHLMVERDSAFWGYAVYQPGVQAIDQVHDLAVAAGFSLMRQLAGVRPDTVLLPRRIPADPSPFREAFGMMPRFDAEQAALVLPARLLRQPIPGADAELRQKLAKAVADYWTIAQPDIASQVIRYLRPRLLLGDASQAAIAACLSMRPRTLMRRLAAEGASFRGLANQTRHEVARQLLTSTRMPITDIAMALQYAHVTAFNRAFRAASGMSPSQCRAASPASP